MTFRTEVKVSGRLFSRVAQKLLRDKTAEIVDRAQKELVKEVRQELDVHIYNVGGAHPEKYTPTGRYRNSINGRMTDTFRAVVDDGGIIYGRWLEGISSRNSATRFKGYGAFRKATERVDKTIGIIGNRAIAELVDDLNS